MNYDPSETTNRILRIWARCARLPLGRRVFSFLVGRAVPFTGVLRPRVTELRPGLARIAVRDRRRLHQHLRSMHAGAAFTLAETASGLAMMAALPDDARAIVKRGSIEFHKKGRGIVTAEARCEVPDPSIEATHEVSVTLTDQANDTVAVATVSWLVGPQKR